MNPTRKSDYTVKNLDGKSHYVSRDDLKAKLSDTLDFPAERFGYIEPGHGLKGKSHWLTTDSDLEEMYQMHKSRREILLWCYKDTGDCQSRAEGQRCKKCSSPGDSDESAAPKPKRDSCAKNIQEVEDIIKALREIHGSTYCTEKLSAWAHLIQMKKHSSYESPPNLPYFKLPKTKKKTKGSETTADEEPAEDQQTSTCTTISPSKRVGLRSECIKQLDQWHTLLEKGGITKDQYDELQKTIFDDIRTNF